MNDNSHRRSVSAPAALLLLAVFGTAILSVLLTGAGTYRRLTERDRQMYEIRTCARYLTARVQRAPSPSAVSVGGFGVSDALEVRETAAGEEYLTRVYCYDGWLMELYTAASARDFAPEDGEKLLPAESMTLDLQGDLLLAEILCGGETVRVTLSLRDGEEAVP